jgi:hypothetical protein
MAETAGGSLTEQRGDPQAPDQRRLFAVIGALMLTMLLAALDQTISRRRCRRSLASSGASTSCPGSLPPTCWR